MISKLRHAGITYYTFIEKWGIGGQDSTNLKKMFFSMKVQKKVGFLDKNIFKFPFKNFKLCQSKIKTRKTFYFALSIKQ